MSRILIATVPITGHVRPGLPIARELVERGHDVRFYTGAKFRDTVNRTGAVHIAPTHGLDFDDADIDAFYEGMARPESPTKRLIQGMTEIFVKPAGRALRDLEELSMGWRPDVLVIDNTFSAGVLYAQLHGVPLVTFGVTALGVRSVDTAPFGLGQQPSSSRLGRLRNRVLDRLMRDVLFRKVQQATVQVRAEVGAPPSDTHFLDQVLEATTVFLQGTTAEFEYPRRDLSLKVRFVGPLLPDPPAGWEPPAWWPELATAREVIVVTQGTVIPDVTKVIVPALQALQARDALIIVTTGAGDPADIPVELLTPNVHVERFVPFTTLLPHADLMVTNGGYGGTQQALAAGVPVVVAGVTEDKIEVNARVQWSGVGVGLKTENPTTEQLRDAIARVTGDPSYRDKAQAMQQALARHHAPRESADLIEAVASRESLPVR